MNVGLLLLIALILGSILFASQWSHSDGRGRTSGGFVFAILWILWWSVGFPKVMHTPRNDVRQDQQHFDAWHTPISVPPYVLPPPSAMPAPDKADKSIDAAGLAVNEPPSTIKKPAADEQPPPQTTHQATRPDWMSQPPTKQGDKYVLPVASGVYTDPAIREQMLEAKMAAAANRYIDEVLYRQGGVADSLTLEPEYLQSFVRARATSPENNETFVRVEFDQHFRDEVERRHKQFISLGRLWQLGIAASGACVVLGGVYLYLRVTQPAKSAANSVQAAA